MPEVDLPIGRDERSLIPPSLQRTVRRSLSRGPEAGVPARSLFGVLPIKWLVPQDIHSLLDYANAFTVAGVALNAKSPTCTAETVLRLSVAGVSLLTDYRLSLRKLSPIEVHESIDAGAIRLGGWPSLNPSNVLGCLLMSDTSTQLMTFGQPVEEPEKNRWVFGMRVRIEPYHRAPADNRTVTKKTGRPDPFAVVISTPKVEP